MPDYSTLSMHPELRLHLIEENVRDCVLFIADPQGRIASWNAGAEHILGYSDLEAIGMDCARLFTPEDREKGAVEQELQIVQTTGRAVDERWHLRKDGSRFWGSGIMTALRDEHGKIVGYAKILRDETPRRHAEEERAKARACSLQRERENAVLQERNRLSQEIHDTLAQNFTGINIQLEAMRDVLPPDAYEALSRLAKAQTLARQGLAEARRSVWALQPQMLEHNTFVAALTRIAEETQAGTGIAVKCSIEGAPQPLPSVTEDHLLRISQEAITNVVRHAQATELSLTLIFGEDTVRLQIQDDGTGFDPHSIGTGYGLTIMRERAERLGGSLTAASEPGIGTDIQVSVPVRVSE